MTGLQVVPDSVRQDSATAAVQEAPVADSAAENLHFHERLSQASELASEGHVIESLESLGENLAVLAAQRIPDLIAAAVAFILLYGLYRFLYSILQRVLRQARYVRRGLETLVLQAFRMLGLVSIGIVVLGQLGLNIGTIIAGVGIAGIALSFAARDTLENIMSGVGILADASFAIGDFVVVQGTYGTVNEITLRSTRILTPRNEMLIVPNKLMANECVFNHSAASPLRVELPFSIGYREQPDEVREVVLALTDDDERLREDQPPRVVITKLADSGVDLSLWLYPKQATHERELRYDYSERILEALSEAGIEIPYPHIQLMVDQANT